MGHPWLSRRSIFIKHNNPVCMLAITTFDIASMVPSNGKISFGEIAERTPMTEEMTTRLLRHAMTMRIFREPEPGMVAHTAASKVLTNQGANAWLQSGTEEMWPAATKAGSCPPSLRVVIVAKLCECQMVDALKRWPGSQEPNETVSPAYFPRGRQVGFPSDALPVLSGILAVQ